MHYVISVLVLAAILTIWGYCASRWSRGHGGCGSCSCGRDGGPPRCGGAGEPPRDEPS